jgi:CRISPR-associated protein Cmr1
MLLAGADGTTPELRAPSIKGALRFWWRAMNGHLSLKDLKEKESQIFGGTSGDSGLRSSFTLQILSQPMETIHSNETWKDIGYEQRISQTGNIYFAAPNRDVSNIGVGYLFYSMWLDGANPRPCIKANQEFSLKIVILKNEYKDDILNSLKGLVYLGGLGSRSRRGAGSFRIKSVLSEEKVLQEECKNIFCPAIKNIKEMKTHIDAQIKIKTGINSDDYSHLKGSWVYFFNNETITSWQGALDEIGLPFKQFRDTNKAEFKDTPNFGFPVLHKSMKTTMQGGKKITKNGKETLEKLERRASPVIFKVIKVDKQYFPIVIWLSGNLLPTDFSIMDKDGGNSQAENDDIVDKFFGLLSTVADLTF